MFISHLITLASGLVLSFEFLLLSIEVLRTPYYKLEGGATFCDTDDGTASFFVGGPYVEH